MFEITAEEKEIVMDTFELFDLGDALVETKKTPNGTDGTSLVSFG
jgi:hypothetical protein